MRAFFALSTVGRTKRPPEGGLSVAPNGLEIRLRDRRSGTVEAIGAVIWRDDREKNSANLQMAFTQP
jgi:hypothetical protein